MEILPEILGNPTMLLQQESKICRIGADLLFVLRYLRFKIITKPQKNEKTITINNYLLRHAGRC
jgi:hypothetical protein